MREVRRIFVFIGNFDWSCWDTKVQARNPFVNLFFM